MREEFFFCASECDWRARCGKTARRDLCRGHRVTGVPTATALKAHIVQVLELRIPPVLQMIIVAVGMWVFSVVFPALNAPVSSTMGLSASSISLGVIVAVLGVLEFRRANTTVDPRFPDRSSRLVVSGVYRISRNPMYLGFFLVLFGWAWYLMNYLAFLLLPLFVVYMNCFQIQPEERYMAQKFGDEFDKYAARVRRWI